MKFHQQHRNQPLKRKTSPMKSAQPTFTRVIPNTKVRQTRNAQLFVTNKNGL